MEAKFYKVLELDKIIDMLKAKAASSLGLSMIEKLRPMSSFEEVKTREFDTCNRRFTIQRLEKP